MKTKRKWIGMLAFIVMIAVLMIVTMQTPGTIADSENYQCQTYATVFALLPPVIAIGHVVIECQYDWATPFVEGVAQVGKWIDDDYYEYYIDTTGNEINLMMN